MGVRELWAGAVATAGLPAAPIPDAATAGAPSSPAVEAGFLGEGAGISSPWQAPSPHLASILWADVFGLLGKDQPITRETAMSVPAVARGRHLLCGFGAKAQPRVFTGETVKSTQPGWVSRTGTALTPHHRMLWTIDDCLFYGWSLWDVERAVAGGPITGGATRVAKHRWVFDKDTGHVKVDGEPFPEKRALLIPGPHEGILLFGKTAIRQASELEASATKVAQNPAAYLNLHYDGDVPLTTEQIDALIERWAAARKGENGGVAYTGKHVTATEMGSAAEHLLIDGRNAAAVNMARLMSMPASMVDATNAGASLTYETTSGRNAEFLDYGVDLYLDAVAARLSMDDVVSPRDSTRFDTAQVRSLTPSPTGPTTED